MTRKSQPPTVSNPDPLAPKPEGPFKVDLSDWKMGEFMAWSETVKNGDIKGMTLMMADVIEKWPFSGQPDDFEAYKTLAPQEWKDAISAVGEATGEAFR